MHVILYTVYHKSTLVMNQEIFLPVGWDIYIIQNISLRNTIFPKEK